MILNDVRIIEEAAKGLISPFINKIQREDSNIKIISKGLSSFGYDISLSDKDFRVFLHPIYFPIFIPRIIKRLFTNKSLIIDPKEFSEDFLINMEVKEDSKGRYFILPPLSYALGVSVEYINLPRYLTAICIGKSTYARAALHLNTTPLESGWFGNITLEMQNALWLPIKVYVNEGIAQLLFLEGEPCLTSYADRKGKYQDQPESVVLAKV